MRALIRFYSILLLLFGFRALPVDAFEFRQLDLQIHAWDSIVLQEGAWTGMLIHTNFNEASMMVEIDGHDFTLKQDPHLPEGYSQIFTFPANSKLVLHSPIDNRAMIFLVAAPMEASLYSPKKHLHKKTFCEKPEVIPPSVWRKGLPDPVAGRDLSEARHMVIHHSAGSNLNTNWVEVVRSIYLLHVQTNNWDDIGYNYLIGGDGSIFIGRDPLDLLEEDAVRGAHFCSKNSGTMGVCMIGTFSDIKPTKQAMSALEQLLVWKLFKENINPYDSFIHPKAGVDYLASVCGHRDGCATECPGEVLYASFDSLKIGLYQSWMNCRMAAHIQDVTQARTPLLYPNPLVGRTLHLRETSEGYMPTAYRLLSINSRVLEQGQIDGSILELSHFITTGRYLLQLKIEDKWMPMPLIVQ